MTRKDPVNRRFIAFILSLALAVSAFGAATPVRADGEDLARALAGIAALAIIGKAIKDSRDDDRKRDRVRRDYYRPAPALKPRPLPRDISRRQALPGDCLREVRTRYGVERVFGARCLQRNYRYAGRLPGACAERVRVGGRDRLAYDARCLRHRGYRISWR